MRLVWLRVCLVRVGILAVTEAAILIKKNRNDRDAILFIRDFTSTMAGTHKSVFHMEKHQETSILFTSIYNKTYIKIIFSAKQLYAISPAH